MIREFNTDLKGVCLMRRGSTLLALVGAVVLVLLAADTALAQDDTIVINMAGSNHPINNVSIGRETYREIRYKVAGSWQQEPTENVVDVVHGDAPPNYLTAQNALNDGNYDRATQGFDACVKHERADWVKAYAQFYLAESYRFWGQSDPAKLEDAIREYEVYLSKNTDHRFVPNAYYGKAIAASAAGQDAKAKAAFDDLATGNYGRKWGIRGRYGSTQMMQPGPAKVKKFEELIQAAKAEDMNDIAAAARLGLAEAELADRKYREAMKIYQEIVSDPENVGKEVLAAAHNGLGQCYSALGSSDDDKKKALFEHLKVVVLYAGARNLYLDSLLKAIKLLEDIGGEDNN
jgi:tetratricopeptide (TPR) repeat protein